MISIETNALGRMISIDINFSFFLLETGFEISVDYRDYRQILPIPMTTDIGNR